MAAMAGVCVCVCARLFLFLAFTFMARVNMYFDKDIFIGINTVYNFCTPFTTRHTVQRTNIGNHSSMHTVLVQVVQLGVVLSAAICFAKNTDCRRAIDLSYFLYFYTRMVFFVGAWTCNLQHSRWVEVAQTLSLMCHASCGLQTYRNSRTT